MARSAVDPDRVAVLHDAPPRPGDYVLYWMQASQRTRFNHALEYAVERANSLGKPLLVLFVLMDDYPEANLRHFTFMLQGLRDVSRNLRRRGAAFVVRRGRAIEVVAPLARRACELVCDRGYLRHQRRWRDEAADAVPCRVTQVESDVVVPVESASDHAEFAARTLRPRVTRQLQRFLQVLPQRRLAVAGDRLPLRGDVDPEDVAAALAGLRVDTGVGASSRFEGGEVAAAARLQSFVRQRAATYAGERSDPSLGGGSELSPYLHFGQVSPVAVALAVRESGVSSQDVDAFLEELIVRRELAINYVYYTSSYDRFEALPGWARRTLSGGNGDPRPVIYSREELEGGRTHDRWWNAAMREMRMTGYMHNYMRMYWGKKVIEWRPSAEAAFEDLLYLNNRYFIDGRDANGYTGVAWCFGLHDRPWKRRAIFGQVRYMNAAGLERKFDMPSYERRVDELSGHGAATP